MSGTSLSSAVTISASDFDRMRRTAFSSSATQVVSADMEAESTLRQTRKMMSQTRAAKWPNTLEGLRKRKEEARQARLDAAEAHQQELDARDEERLQNQRLEILRKAADEMIEKSEKMKMLRNYRNQSNQWEILKLQQAIKQERDMTMRAGAEAAHAAMMEAIARGNAEEDRKAERARQKAKELAATQQQQLREVVDQRLAELRETEAQGRRMAAQVERLIAEEQAAMVARKDAGRARNMELTLENTRLLEFRNVAKAKDEEAMKYYAKQAAAKEAFDAKKLELIERRRVEAAAKAKRIADAVSARTSAATLAICILLITAGVVSTDQIANFASSFSSSPLSRRSRVTSPRA